MSAELNDNHVSRSDAPAGAPTGDEDWLPDDGDGGGPAPPPAERASSWTIPALCIGIAIIACCVLIPQADANRRLAYEREKLTLDLQSIEQQVRTNDEFLRKVADDPNLAERLAQRQMKIIREGTRVLRLKGDKSAGGEMSPFHLVNVPPPAPMPPYKPKGGVVAGLCYDPHSRLYLMGAGLALIAVGLVFGAAPRP